MKLPPKQIAWSDGHFLHSPGLSMVLREKDVFAGHSMHLLTISNEFAYCPLSVNLSPGRHFLTVSFSSKLMSVSSSTGLVLRVVGDVALFD